MTDYTKRINKVIDMFKDDDLYKACLGFDESLSEWRIFRKYSRKVLDTTWIEVIEDALESLDKIVRNPRRFIVVEEDLIDTSRAKTVSEEAVKYLAQHTNYIHGFDGDMVIPSKLLNSTKEESYEVYENRFIFTLLKRLSAFVKKRYDAVKQAAKKNEQIELVIDRPLTLGTAKISMRLDSILKMPFEEALKLNSEELGPIERLAKIHTIISGFMSTPFAKEMVHCEAVRPPIQRTNAILKNPDLRKALSLWEFLQDYDDDGYEIRAEMISEEMPEALKKQYRVIVFLNSLFMQNLTSEDFKVKGTRTKYEQENNFNVNDFPKSDIGVEEIKTISVPSPYDSSLKEVERAEIAAAIDRALAQHKLNLTNEDNELYNKRLAAQRKRETEYKERILRLRKKERELLAKEEKAKERERLKAEGEAQKAELDRIKKEKAEEREAQKQQKILDRLEVEMKRLDEEAVNMVIKETRNEQLAANRSKITREIIYLNSLRAKLKGEFGKVIDSQIDELIKLVPKIFKVNV